MVDLEVHADELQVFLLQRFLPVRGPGAAHQETRGRKLFQSSLVFPLSRVILSGSYLVTGLPSAVSRVAALVPSLQEDEKTPGSSAARVVRCQGRGGARVGTGRRVGRGSVVGRFYGPRPKGPPVRGQSLFRSDPRQRKDKSFEYPNDSRGVCKLGDKPS